jgi:hypothetical protein
MDLPMPSCAQTRTPTAFEDQDACGLCGYWACRCAAQAARRLVVAGIVRRTAGRIVRITITPAGVTGSIRPAGAR